ncbi:unnamed protein product [Citrullus colocynthis]|uniref:Uncharacterized protein n=1 Tax=Citrullus colocynthis TaxID=252529 RepID=A0ABP0ZB94_9ROSI
MGFNLISPSQKDPKRKRIHIESGRVSLCSLSIVMLMLAHASVKVRSAAVLQGSVVALLRCLLLAFECKVKRNDRSEEEISNDFDNQVLYETITSMIDKLEKNVVCGVVGPTESFNKANKDSSLKSAADIERVVDPLSEKNFEFVVTGVDAPNVCPEARMEVLDFDNVDNEAHLGANAGSEDDALS